jgi:hypothetical protein
MLLLSEIGGLSRFRSVLTVSRQFGLSHHPGGMLGALAGY